MASEAISEHLISKISLGSMHAPDQEIRWSELASEAILGQKQNRKSYMARGVLHPIFGCPRMQLACKREGTKVGRTPGGVI